MLKNIIFVKLIMLPFECKKFPQNRTTLVPKILASIGDQAAIKISTQYLENIIEVRSIKLFTVSDRDHRFKYFVVCEFSKSLLKVQSLLGGESQYLKGNELHSTTHTHKYP